MKMKTCLVLFATVAISLTNGAMAEGVAGHSQQIPVINGSVEGDIKVNQGGALNLNGQASINGNLILPGTPRLRFNGGASPITPLDAGGSQSPLGYKVQINRGAILNGITIRSDAEDLPEVSRPSICHGTRWVSINRNADIPADFSDVRGININSGAGPVSIPAGCYDQINANKGSSLILGIEGSNERVLYEFGSLNLNGATIEIHGPVRIVVRNGISVNSGARLGVSGSESLLWLEVFSGSVDLNAHSSFYGSILAPSGEVRINAHAQCVGRVAARKIVVNGHGTLKYAPVDEQTPPENHPPVARSTSHTMIQGETLALSLEAEDPDGDPLLWQIQSIPAHGELSTAQGVTIEPEQEIHPDDFPLSFVALPDYSGDDTLSFVVSDGKLTSEAAEASITILPFVAPQAVFSIFPDAYTQDFQPVVEVALAEGSYPLNADAIRFLVNGQPMGHVVSESSHRIEWGGDLLDGGYEVQFEVSDAQGHSVSISREFIVDSTPPVVGVQWPSVASITENSRPSVRFSVTDSVSEVQAGSVSVEFGSIASEVTHGGSTFVAVPDEPLDDGICDVTIHAMDMAGNPVVYRTSFSVDSPLLAPEVTGLPTKAGGAVYVGEGDPVEGARVTIRGQEGGVRTDESGKFMITASDFDDLEARFEIFEFSAPGYITSYRRVLLYPDTINTVPPVYMKKRDRAVTVVGSSGGTATNSDGSIVVQFPAGALSGDTPIQATNYDFARELQGPLPMATVFTYALEMYPEGLTFPEPVTIRFKNTLGFDPGTTIPVGYFNPETVRWEHESQGTVQEDGEWIEFQVTHFSTWDINPGSPRPTTPVPDTNNTTPSDNSGDDNRTDPYVSIGRGSGHQTIELPSYQSLGRVWSPVLHYDSNLASGTGMITVPYESQAAVSFGPATFQRFTLHFGGETDEVQSKAFGVSYNLYHGSIRFRRENLPTGIYPHKFEMADVTTQPASIPTYFGDAPVSDTDVPIDPSRSLFATELASLVQWRNESTSPFGAGWTLSSISSLVVSTDRRMAAVFHGDGGYTRFEGVMNALSLATKPLPTKGNNGAKVTALSITPSGTFLMGASDGGIYERKSAVQNRLIAGHVDVTALQVGYGPAWGDWANPEDKENGERVKVPYEILSISESPTGVLWFAASVPRDVPPCAIHPFDGYPYVIFRKNPASGLLGAVLSTQGPVSQMAFNHKTGDLLFIENGKLTGYRNALFVGDCKTVAEADLPDLVGLAVDNKLNRTYVSTTDSVYCFKGMDPLKDENPEVVCSLGMDYEEVDMQVMPNGDLCILLGSTVIRLDSEGNQIGLVELSNGRGTYVSLAADPRDGLYALEYYGALVRVLSNLETEYRNREWTEAIEPVNNQWRWSDLHGNVRIYSQEGLLLTETDRDGNTISYTYDLDGRVRSIRDPVGMVTTFTYGGDHLASVIDPAGRTTRFSHNSEGQLIRVSYPDGSSQAFDYDEENHMLAFSDQEGYQTSFEIDEEGIYKSIQFPDTSMIRFRSARTIAAAASRPRAPGVFAPSGSLPSPVSADTPDFITSPLGHNFAYLTNSRGQFTKIVDAIGGEADFGRDYLGRLLWKIDPLGREAHFTYDPQGNVTRRVRPDGLDMTLDYDPSLNLPTHIKRFDGESIDVTYDNNGKPTLIRNAQGNETRSEFNSRGQVTSITNSLGERWTFAYDLKGNRTSTTNPLGRSTTYEYDSAGNVTSETDPSGLKTRYTYDSMGRLLTTTLPSGGVIKRTYNKRGQVLTETDPEGRTTSYEYDGRARLVVKTDPAGGKTRMTYDADDNLIEVVNPSGEIRTMTYDGNRRMITLQEDSDPAITFVYDEAGRVIETIDPQGRSSKKVYDLLGRITEEIRPDGKTVSYEYDDNGNMTLLTDPQGAITRWTYDEVGNRLSETDASGNKVSYHYDSIRRLTSMVNRRGDTITYEYDAAGRKIKEELGDGDINEFTYDAAGRMLTAVNAHSTVTFTYDAAGRLASTSQPAGDVSYAYNAANQTISRTDSANAVTYEYDRAGRMVQLGSSAFGVFSFEHDAASRMNRVLYPNGVDLDLKRDGRGRITEIAFTRSGVYLDGEMRSLDAVGNTTTRERSGEDELHFGYDNLDQLLQVAAGMSVEEVYAYDSVGNWAVDGRRHDACNRLTQDETRTFDYDRDGNLTSIHDSGGDGSASYSYDALGRLVSATLSTGETITYRYDAIGRRYAVSTSAGTTFTLFDGWQEIGTVEPDGSSRSMLAVGEFRLASDTASGPMYVHAGLEGSVIAITNVLGELVERYRYTAFGLLTVLDAEGEEKDGEALSPWLYHGRLFEEASGLYWMRMRHYSPDLGRFLQPDPAGIAGGINLYAYSNNNPLRYFDPWGLWPAPDASGGSDGKYGEMNSSRYRRISRWIHGILSVAGAVPLFGVIPDAVDLLYTLAELPSGHSSGSDVVLGAAAVGAVIVPVAGDGAAAAAKIANRALDAGEVIAKKGGDEFVDVYRAFGDDARAQGFSWTTTDPRTVSNFRDAAGLPSGGASGANNSADFLIQGRARASDIIESRSALPLDGNRGGLPELIIDPKNVEITDFSVLN